MATLSDTQIKEHISNARGWETTHAGSQPGIMKSYDTGSFMKGLAFVTQVAVLAEKANHHPDVTLTYPKVTLQLTSHDAGGLTERDFALARQIDAIPF